MDRCFFKSYKYIPLCKKHSTESISMNIYDTFDGFLLYPQTENETIPMRCFRCQSYDIYVKCVSFPLISKCFESIPTLKQFRSHSIKSSEIHLQLPSRSIK